MVKLWIAGATKKNKGAFKRQAKKAGMTTAAFAAASLKPGSKATAKTKKRANLAKILSGLRPK